MVNMIFDPENVPRWDEDGYGGEVVSSEHYDALLFEYQSLLVTVESLKAQLNGAGRD